LFSATVLEPDFALGSLDIKELAFFFSRFLRQPANVASICPSSRYLSKKMVSGLQLGPDDVVLEFGPGTGSFTKEVYALRQSPRYLGIEQDPGMHGFLASRYEGFRFVLGDVRDVKSICAAQNFPPATVVICGVPLILMDEHALTHLLDDVSDCMAGSGVFRTFSYLHCYPTKAASRLRARVNASFEGGFHCATVIRNMPPAQVLTGEKTA
jgi:phospholipid N-methyltransferase